jgi:hypothetical protein
MKCRCDALCGDFGGFLTAIATIARILCADVGLPTSRTSQYAADDGKAAIMIAIIALASLFIGVSVSIARAVRIVRIGAADSGDLTTKLVVPFPDRAADWPEIRLDAVVPDPDHAERVLLVARWPAHPERRALLVLDIDDGASRAQRLLMGWRDADASLSPLAIAANELVLRRRRTKDAVHALVVRESALVGDDAR